MNQQPIAWLTPKEAAAFLALHPDTLRRYRREGGGPPFAHIGRVINYEVALLKARYGAALGDLARQ